MPPIQESMLIEMHRVLVVLLAVTFVLLAVTAQSAMAGSTISGASNAECTPAPCTSPDKITEYKLAGVSDGDGTTSPRSYAVYRPMNLTPSQTNLAPAMLIFYGNGLCGLEPISRFDSLAAENRFIVVYMEVPCERSERNWGKKNVNSPTTSTPNDEPYVAAVVNAITQCPNSGAGPNQCADPQRIYAAGTSSGGNMAADIMCDAQNSPLFRGYLIDSSSLQLFTGAPDCPSTNRSFFVMMAMSDYGADSGVYYNTAPNPHLDVPAFADWAAARLGCTGSRVDDAIGSPIASTLRYIYTGPCAYATTGSPAVVTLGVQNGGHMWNCQDSDALAQPNACKMPEPPGLSSSGLPMTNGLFVEQAFWHFVSQGVSTSAPAPALSETTSPVVTVTAPSNGATLSGTVSIIVHAADDSGLASVRIELDGANLGTSVAMGEGTYSLPWSTTAAANGSHMLRALATDTVGNLAISAIRLTIDNTVGEPLMSNNVGKSLITNNIGGSFIPNENGGSPNDPVFVALGDGYSSGDGNSSYLPGTDTARDRCHRSTISYPYMASTMLSGGPSGLVFRACSGATIADLYKGDARNHEPPELQSISQATRLVSVSIGWDDALLPSILRSCVLDTSRCEARWHARAAAALKAIGGRSAQNGKSLYALYREIVSLASRARIAVFSYPGLFPAVLPARCRTGFAHRVFTRSAMKWIDSVIDRLNETIKAAATAAHANYIEASHKVFAGHELCTRRPALRGAMSIGMASGHRLRRAIDANASFGPNRRGEMTLAKLLESAL